MDTLGPMVRRQVARYLTDEIRAADLYAWLGLVAWGIEQQTSAPVADLVRDVELYLEEFHHGDWTEDELRSHLRGALRVIACAPALHHIDTSTSSQAVRCPVATRLGAAAPRLQWRGAGTQDGTGTA